MIKIAFIGAGAVGGYFGGLMSAYYENSIEAQVFFSCREKTEDIIKQSGLHLETTHGDYHIHPKLIVQHENDSIIFDYIVCCTKSYDLENSLESFRNHIDSKTVIIPLLNGVDSYDRIKVLYPDNEVWDACVYIVSHVIKPGQVKETGGIQLMYFGSRDGYSEKLETFNKLFHDAGIKITISENILQTIWIKFVFISSIATLTSYLEKSIGEILEEEEYSSIFHKLLFELKLLAEAKNISLPENIFDTTYARMRKLPYETTSSMHRDFLHGNKTELETLTGSVVRMANESDIEVPEYKKIYLQLKLKAESV